MNEPIEVLIVEDDPRIAEIHRRFTEKVTGFRVVGTAANVEQACEWLEILRPQLVLLDVYLPDMKGTELVQRIRASFSETDIIMITAASEAEIVRQAFRGGVFDYIVKPLTFDRFKAGLDSYRSRTDKLRKSQSLTQEEIETIWARGQESAPAKQEVPKGIDPLTLRKIKDCIAHMGEGGLTAEELSVQAGVSRSTARRYLEYLIQKKEACAQLIYGTVGRPERRYFSAEP